jgi:hypothetical protein
MQIEEGLELGITKAGEKLNPQKRGRNFDSIKGRISNVQEGNLKTDIKLFLKRRP